MEIKNNNALIIFVKNPIKGRVKSRLAKTIGEEKALKIYKDLIAHTLEITLPLECNKIVYYSDFIPATDQWSQMGYRQELQNGDDLGQRMYHAFEKEFEKRRKNICIIGTDCPELNTNIIVKAFDQLQKAEIVIGPATDGGYYLLGMQHLQKKIFEKKQWSSPTVFADTIKDIETFGIKHNLLPMLNDIDEEKDLIAMLKAFKNDQHHYPCL